MPYIKCYTEARKYHRAYLNKLNMLESIHPHFGELFESISNAEFGLTLFELVKSEDRMQLEETRIRLDLMLLDGHLAIVEGRYYNYNHIELEEK